MFNPIWNRDQFLARNPAKPSKSIKIQFDYLETVATADLLIEGGASLSNADIQKLVINAVIVKNNYASFPMDIMQNLIITMYWFVMIVTNEIGKFL